MTVADPAIPGYTDVTELSRGGFATIYRARQPTFEREVAIKVLSDRVPSGKADESSTRRFQRECAAIGALSGHPNIVTVYEAGTTEDGRLYLVMEFLEGGSLADQVAQRGPFGVAEVLDLGGRIAGAVESAHRIHILHRDLKPENILLSRLGEPKVADFGLAHLPGVQQSVSGGLTGTIVHAAPEILAGEEPTVASDIYSLASTLWCLLAGRPPFAGAAGDVSLVSTLDRITNQAPPDLRTLGIPEELCRVLEHGLAKAPGDRPHDVGQFGRQLQAVQAALGLPITRLPIESAEPLHPAPSVRGAPTPHARRLGRRPRRLIIGTVLVAALALVAITVARNYVDRRPGLSTLYRDDFDGGHNWSEGDDEGATTVYEQGRYRMLVKRPQQVFSDTYFPGGVYGDPLTNLTDVSIEVQAERVSAEATFGLFCRLGPPGEYYQAEIDAHGQARIFKWQHAHETTLARGVVPAGTGTSVNLQLECMGDKTSDIALYVDHQKVAETSDDDPIAAGSVGLMVRADAPPADVYFDDFHLLGRRRTR